MIPFAWHLIRSYTWLYINIGEVIMDIEFTKQALHDRWYKVYTWENLY